MPDTIVNLSVLPTLKPFLTEQKADGIEVRQALANENEQIATWVRLHCNPSWVIACEEALEQEPISCYIAVKDKKFSDNKGNLPNLQSDDIVGFACFDVAAQGVLGPVCVLEDYEEKFVKVTLMLTCLYAMKEKNYESVTIGWGSFIGVSTGSLEMQ